MQSHPSWVRGLKPTTATLSGQTRMSHPSWVRGLKLCFTFLHYGLYQVAPLVGAWIETVMQGRAALMQGVAPLVGAWIETGHPY